MCTPNSGLQGSSGASDEVHQLIRQEEGCAPQEGDAAEVGEGMQDEVAWEELTWSNLVAAGLDVILTQQVMQGRGAEVRGTGELDVQSQLFTIGVDGHLVSTTNPFN